MTASEAQNYERIAADAENRAEQSRRLGLNRSAAAAENSAKAARDAAARVRHLP